MSFRDVYYCRGYFLNIYETKTEFNYKLGLWRAAVESIGFKLSRTKTEYVACRVVIKGKEVISIL